MSTYKSEGIIIRRHNFGESSLILDFYTKEHGKVEAVARSARKLKGKLKGHLELFLHADLIFAHGRHLDKTANSFTINSFSNLRKDLRATFSAYYFCELTEKMTIAGHRDERIYHLLKECLLFLDEAENFREPAGAENGRGEEFMDTLSLLILFFQLNILDLNGYSAHLQKCVFCAEDLKAGRNYFSHALGGIVCGDCIGKDSSAVRLDDNSIKLLRLLQFSKGQGVEDYLNHLSKKFGEIGKISIKEESRGRLIHLLNSFIEFNMERKIKSVDFVVNGI